MTQPTPIPCYLFKEKRYESDITLRELAKQINIDHTYLSKIENGQLLPSEERLNQLHRFYKITQKQFDYCQFTKEFIQQQLNKIYYVEFTKEDYARVEQMAYQHRNSQYLGHLKLILWCYNAMYVHYDSSFDMEMEILDDTIHAFSDEELEFYYICKCIVHTQRRQKKQAKSTLELLLQKQTFQWPGFVYFAKVKYDYYFQYFLNITRDIEICKEFLLKDNNTKRVPFMKMFEALYYSYLGLHDHAIQIYEQQLSYMNQINDNLNISVLLANIGNQYLYKHQYKRASEYLKKATVLKNDNATYFDLAWCYYNLGQMEACEKTIRQSVKAKTQYPAYTELLEWLFQMVKRPYSKTCLNSLLRIEKNYLDQLGPRGKVLVYGAISNHYQHEHNYEMANHYLKKIIQENMTTAIELN